MRYLVPKSIQRHIARTKAGVRADLIAEKQKLEQLIYDNWFDWAACGKCQGRINEIDRMLDDMGDA